ncbi:uncharacterized protein [Lepeophtheirus salmonis]|uniref:uncharacterized protein n=1 Tax=Lepeophtheirus salmonis TaxID=72036 RepID=UPI001AEA5386|nr:uncharacterized protein LOC121128480 [Lepeophtheirus salmonis]XP_040580022.1 uncharacterized protein LOC121128504 [Lepeophtheirus salmonis]
MTFSRFILLCISYLLPLIASSTIPQDKIVDPRIFRSSFALRRIPELSPRMYKTSNQVPVYFGRYKRGGYTANGGVYSQFNDGAGHRNHEGGRGGRHRPQGYSHIRNQNQFHSGSGRVHGNDHNSHNNYYGSQQEYSGSKNSYNNGYNEKGGFREGYEDFEKEFGDYNEGEEGRDYEVIYYKAQTSPPDYDEGRGVNPQEIVEYDDGRSGALSVDGDSDGDDGEKHVFDEDPGFGGRTEESNGEGVKVSTSPIDSFGEFF